MPWSPPIGPAATGGDSDTGCQSAAASLVGRIGFSPSGLRTCFITSVDQENLWSSCTWSVELVTGASELHVRLRRVFRLI
ncbi:hypothetical protein EYF80_066194 [Liparis tanakae]|uniref:Uncharacterized protein n=1 Tax=Liparis tanakae TaxID=230148 RepID=A0A4Z2E4Z1_9TELE|nr:hypothetical protein EYF80_066194 [Liparis tanakae]